MPASDTALRPPGSLNGAPIPVTPDLAYLRTAIVNLMFVGLPESGSWVLVDAGLQGFGEHIADAGSGLGSTEPFPVAARPGR